MSAPATLRSEQLLSIAATTDDDNRYAFHDPAPFSSGVHPHTPDDDNADFNTESITAHFVHHNKPELAMAASSCHSYYRLARLLTRRRVRSPSLTLPWHRRTPHACVFATVFAWCSVPGDEDMPDMMHRCTPPPMTTTRVVRCACASTTRR
eukprot:8943380-Pyramimonas_sp.AAC.1